MSWNGALGVRLVGLPEVWLSRGVGMLISFFSEYCSHSLSCWWLSLPWPTLRCFVGGKIWSGSCLRPSRAGNRTPGRGLIPTYVNAVDTRAIEKFIPEIEFNNVHLKLHNHKSHTKVYKKPIVCSSEWALLWARSSLGLRVRVREGEVWEKQIILLFKWAHFFSLCLIQCIVLPSWLLLLRCGRGVSTHFWEEFVVGRHNRGPSGCHIFTEETSFRHSEAVRTDWLWEISMDDDGSLRRSFVFICHVYLKFCEHEGRKVRKKYGNDGKIMLKRPYWGDRLDELIFGNGSIDVWKTRRSLFGIDGRIGRTERFCIWMRSRWKN